MMTYYGVIGNPISHSKSPQIHTEFAKQTGQDLKYSALKIPENHFLSSLKFLQKDGFKGVNITVPYKELAWHLVADKSDYAQRAGAVNTVVFNDDGSFTGHNTDGIGLCRDLVNNHSIELSNKRLLLLGSGGAARGVIEALLAHQPTSLFIANRTASKAKELSELFADFGNVQGGGFDDLNDAFDVIINATSASLKGEVPPLPDTIVTDTTCCYDMMYGDTDTAFITWAKQHNAAKAIDGLGMLVEQAAESFYLWRRVKPETQKVIELIRNQQ